MFEVNGKKDDGGDGEKDQCGFGVLIWEHIWTIWRNI